jgi:PKD repeat protein
VGPVAQRRRAWGLTTGVFGVVALLALIGAFLPGPPSRPAQSGDRALISDSGARNFTLAADGSSPGAVGLAWTGPVGVLFVSFAVYVSSASSVGPWTKLATFYNPYAHQYFADGLSPDTPYWWRVAVDDQFSGTNQTNVVFAPTSAAPAAWVEQSGPGRVNLNWIDTANYTNVIGFVSYQVLSVRGDGPMVRLATISDPATRSYSLTSVANNSTLSLEVVATDRCLSGSNCGPQPSTLSATSNLASLTTAPSLGLRVEARPSPSLPQTTMQFLANETGGFGPFAFVWTFGDDVNATGASVVHRYAASGTYNATCWVTDAFGSTVNATLSVRVEWNVTANGSSGNGSPAAGPPPLISSPFARNARSGLPSDGLNDASVNDPLLAIIFVAMAVYAVVWRRWEGRPPVGPTAGASAPESLVPPRRE